MALSNLPHFFASKLGFDHQRVQQFVDANRAFLNYTTRLILWPHWLSFRVIVHRFVNARFSNVSLLTDWKNQLETVRGSIDFGPVLTELLMGQFLIELQERIIQKLLAHPKLLHFSNTSIWNAFLTVLETDLRISLAVLREFVLAVNMAPVIAENPELASELCPGLRPVVVAFCLKSFAPDESMAAVVSPDRFMAHFGIEEIPETMEYASSSVMGFAKVYGFHWERWSKRKLGRLAVQNFPSLEQYTTE
jgi:hypothetical protein